MIESQDSGRTRPRRREATAIDGRLPSDLLRSLAESQVAGPDGGETEPEQDSRTDQAR